MKKAWLKFAVAALGAAVVAGCTPADEEYCGQFGVEGTAEYGKCIGYFHQQEGAFRADRAFCELDADQVYPLSLYDRGSYGRVVGGNAFWAGRYYPGGFVEVQPDYYHNAEVDRLRMRIIEPCMQARGWKSGTTWQAGRKPVVKAKPPVAKPKPMSPILKATGNALPWIH